jgi:hypothetical protein
VLRDLEQSQLDERHKALFRFIDKVNRDSPRITPEDIDLLHHAGWEDDEPNCSRIFNVKVSLPSWNKLSCLRAAGGPEF